MTISVIEQQINEEIRVADLNAVFFANKSEIMFNYKMKCFDPESPMNEKLKEAMLKMLGEAKI